MLNRRSQDDHHRPRRGTAMHKLSAADLATSTPEPAVLHSVPTVSQHLTGSAQDRAVVLGGPQSTSLPSFTISPRLRGRHVLVDTDFTPDEIAEVLDTATRIKRMWRNGQPHGYLSGKTLGMIFQHPSTRTRVSFEAGMAQLGGQAIFLGVNDLQMKRGETIGDTAQILSRYVDAVVARVADHNDLVTLAGSATIPVMNGLSNKCHPLQALADLLTLQESFGDLNGLKLAYLGDGNNMAASLMLSGAAMGVSVSVAAPANLQVSPDIVQHAQWLAKTNGATIEVTSDAVQAVKGADAVYTDVHVSMGQLDGAARAVALAPYKVTPELMAEANPKAVFMHCLPMHRDEEVSAVVADGPQSIIFDQAENRLHMHKALLLHTLC
jgi:ornithine carbamoyltransferase